jgi:hypothetical protein
LTRIDQSYELNCFSNEIEEDHLRSPTYHYMSPKAIVVGVHFWDPYLKVRVP